MQPSLKLKYESFKLGNTSILLRDTSVLLSDVGIALSKTCLPLGFRHRWKESRETERFSCQPIERLRCRPNQILPVKAATTTGSAAMTPLSRCVSFQFPRPR